MEQYKRGAKMKISNKLRLLFGIVSLAVCLSVASFSVMADEEKKYFNEQYTYDEMKSSIEPVYEQFASYLQYPENEKRYIESKAETELDKTLYKTLYESVGYENAPAYNGSKDFNINEYEGEDGIVRCEITATLMFDNVDVKSKIVYVIFSKADPTVESIEFSKADAEENESFKDKMISAAGNTAMGMGTVFCVLILISLIISCFTFIPKIQAAFTKKSEYKEMDSAPVQTDSTNEVSENLTDDLELVAVISAAIAASELTTTDNFVVRSIRRR